MGVYIKDIEIPKDCAHCPFCEGNTMDGLCRAAGKWFDDEYKAPENMKSRWIPCSERLPEENGKYLIVYDKGCPDEYTIGIENYEVDCESFGFWNERVDPISWGVIGYDWIDQPVLAWMPLPDPYRREE